MSRLFPVIGRAQKIAIFRERFGTFCRESMFLVIDGNKMGLTTENVLLAGTSSQPVQLYHRVKIPYGEIEIPVLPHICRLQQAVRHRLSVKRNTLAC